MRRDLMDMKVAAFYRRVLKAELLGNPPICQDTLRKLLKDRGMIEKTEPSKPRRKYEMSHFGELWVGDFMHGPKLAGAVRGGREIMKKAILLAIIDDYSRLIVGAKWNFEETTGSIEQVFKEAVLVYGKPNRLYVDNGPSFSSGYLRLVCAHLDIGLVHSKPYDSPSRGKIERFFRTVREDFLVDSKAKTLAEINEQFLVWLRDEYHHRHHHGIDCRPIDRYRRSIHDYPRAGVNEDRLEEFFMVRVARNVKKDATIAYDKLIYEVPPRFIGKKIEIRYRQDRPKEIFLYEGGKCISVLKVVDARANAKTYKPKNRDSVIPYQEGEK
jgi:transposase InsO family protein